MISIKKGKWIIFFLLVSLLAQKGWADKETQLFTGEGIVRIFDENVLAARGEALEKARINALERAIEEILSFEVIEERRDVIESVIFPKARMYLLKTEIIKEKEEDGLYKVKIRATIDLNALEKMVRDEGLMPKRGLAYKPRIMIIIPEEHLGRQIPDPAAETEIIRQFVEERFYVVDQNQIAEIRYNDETLAAARGGLEAAAAIGRKYGAEVIIMGEAFSEYVGQEKGMVLSSARVEIRAIKTDTAQILYADAKDTSALAVSENIAAKRALQRAAGLLGPELIEEILAWAEVDKEEGRMITLYIPNISYSQLIIVKEVIGERVPGVDRYVQRSYTGGIGEIEIVYRGESQELADAIQEILFEDFYLRVKNFTENRIDYEIVKPEKKVAGERITERIETKKVSLLPETFIMEGIWKLTVISVEFLPGRKNLRFDLLIENLQDKPADFVIWSRTYLLDNLGTEYQVSKVSPSGERKLIQNMPVKATIIFPELGERAEDVVLHLHFGGYDLESKKWISDMKLYLGPTKLAKVPLIKQRLEEVSLPKTFVTEDSNWSVTVDSYELLEKREVQFTLLIENLQDKSAECTIDRSATYLLDNLANEYYDPNVSIKGYKKFVPHMPMKAYVIFPELKEEVEAVVLYLRFAPDEGNIGDWAIGPLRLEN